MHSSRYDPDEDDDDDGDEDDDDDDDKDEDEDDEDVAEGAPYRRVTLKQERFVGQHGTRQQRRSVGTHNPGKTLNPKPYRV